MASPRTLFNHLPDTIPFERERNSGYTSWVIAFIMYIAILATFSALVLFSLFEYWNPDATKTLTLEIPYIQKPAHYHGNQEAFTDERIAKTIDVLSESPLVTKVSVLSETEMQRLLEPWFGKNFDVFAIPLPSLMDVHIKPEVDKKQVQTFINQLDHLIPGAQFVDTTTWQSMIEKMVFKLQIFISVLLLVILIIAMWTISFTTRTNMMMQRDIMELLPLLGATDVFIINRLKGKTLALAFESMAKALFGLLLTGLLIWWVLHDINDQAMTQILWHLVSWKSLFLLLIPAFIIVLMIHSAKRSVCKTLEELF